MLNREDCENLCLLNLSDMENITKKENDSMGYGTFSEKLG